jgi:putative (di)nucleoside polyphosphate hydrolase
MANAADGIEDGESPRVAAVRELRQELGTSHVEVSAETGEWLRCALPAALIDRFPLLRWRGQQQK